MTGGEHSPPSGAAQDDVDRTLVEITEDVGLVYGTDGREYDLRAGDVVTLPSIIVELLLEKDAAASLSRERDEPTSRPPSVMGAEAVAGDEPTPNVDSDPSLPLGIEWEMERRREATTDDDGNEDDFSAAAFMDPDSAHAGDEDPKPQLSTASEASYERTVSALPLAQLDALTPDERRRAAASAVSSGRRPVRPVTDSSTSWRPSCATRTTA